jgi:hypothetical protein
VTDQHIYANGKPVALYRRLSTGANVRVSVLTDHLGSTDMLGLNSTPNLRDRRAG